MRGGGSEGRWCFDFVFGEKRHIVVDVMRSGYVYIVLGRTGISKRIHLGVGLLPFHALQSGFSREILISKADLEHVTNDCDI